MVLSLAKKNITKTCLFYVTFLFVHFNSKELIFVYKHTLGTERLVTSDCSVSALTDKSIYFFFSSVPIKLGKRKEFSEDLTQTMVNLALKGYCLPKIGRLVNRNTFNCIVYC